MENQEPAGYWANFLQAKVVNANLATHKKPCSHVNWSQEQGETQIGN